MENLAEIKGFLLYKENTTKKSEVIAENDQQLMQNERDAELTEKFKGKDVADFVPCFMLEQQAQESFLEYDDFDNCVDEYFSQSLKQKEKQKLDGQENAIYSKMNKIQEDQDKRIQGLLREQDLSEYKA